MSFKIYGIEQADHPVEKRVFDAFMRHAGLLDKLFSFGIANWARYGDEMESDLILVGKLGIFVIEIKGGKIDIREGVYHQNGKEMKTPPLKQASNNYWKVVNLLEENGLSKFRSISGGYVCLFPDTTWDYNADVANKNIILDFAFDQSLQISLRKVADFYRVKNSEQGFYTSPISQQSIAKIKSILVGDTKKVSDIRQNINLNVHKYVELSEEQYERYQEIAENNHIIIKGPPGSGKTLLAYQIMKDSEQNKVRTLFLCKNKALAIHLRQKIANELGGHPEHVTIINIDQYARQYADTDTALTNFKNIVNSATANLQNNASSDRFDYLIIDEGQDLMSYEYIKLIDALVEGGVEKGRWCMFIDFDQNLLNAPHSDTISNDAEELYEVYFADRATIKRLTKNYRNTDIIQRTASVLSKTAPVAPSGLHGESPEFKIYRSIEEEARMVSDDINNLVDSGIRPSEITVLSFVGRDRSVAGQDLVRLKNGIRLKHINEPDLSGVSGVDITVNYASIYEYKGLDNEVILLTDVNDLDRNMVSGALHLVGATRARNHYIVYVTPDVMTRLLDPNEGNLLHSIDPSYIN